MTIPSVPQTLPAHVLDAIVNHVPLTPPPIGSVYQTKLLAPLLPALLPLLGVCRSWRYAACSVLYRTAYLDINKTTYMFEHRSALCLHDIADNELRRFVSNLHISVDLSNFSWQWVSDTPNALSTLRDCGALLQVRCLYLQLELHLQNVDSMCDERLVTANAGAFVQYIKEAMPRLCHLSVYYDFAYRSSPAIPQIESTILHRLAQLVDIHSKQLALSDSVISRGNMSDLILPSLQKLTLYNLINAPDSIALVKRCASTLEHLCLERGESHSALKLTWGDMSDRSKTWVYPCLKHFVVACSYGARDPTHQQPLVNPFPQLETLVYRGTFPFSTPVVFDGCQSRLRHLDMWLDMPLIAMLEDNHIFVRGVFTRLSYVSLRWATYEPAPGYDKNYPLRMALELCDRAETVCMPEGKLVNVARALAQVHIPETLRTLNLGGTRLTIDQAIAILCACRNLLKANISLTDISDGVKRAMPTKQTLCKYQEKYSPATSTVKCVGIPSWHFRSQRRAAEFILLLADILTSISRICVSPTYSSALAGQVLDNFSKARKRSVYDGHTHLDEVQFLMDRCW